MKKRKNDINKAFIGGIILLMINAICGSVPTMIQAEEIIETDQSLHVSELDLGDYEPQMEVGTSQILSITPLPIDAIEKTIIYSSSETDVATVNSMGRVSALKTGKTIITVSCGEISSEIEIFVIEKKDETVAVTGIEIANYEDKLNVDETMNLTATVLPTNATDSNLIFKSSDESIATVSSTGEVKGIKAGKVTISVSAGSVTENVDLEVAVTTKDISLNREYLVLKTGESFTLSGTVSPANAIQSLSFKSMDENVAVVSSAGVVTAKTVGNTSIIVSNGDYQTAVSVIVNAADTSSKTNQQDGNRETDTRNEEENYPEQILVADVELVDSDTLKYLYENQESLLIQGIGYSISVDGKNIVNYKNELLTDIELKDGKNFEINDGNPLCGQITLSIDQVNGKYLYLYNESKEQYELLDVENFLEIEITTPGKYLITEKKLNSKSKSVLSIVVIGGLASLIGVGIYIGIKKKYWFW